jgi:hypothetical protein
LCGFFFADNNGNKLKTPYFCVIAKSGDYGLEFRGHYLQQSGYDYRYKFNDIELDWMVSIIIENGVLWKHSRMKELCKTLHSVEVAWLETVAYYRGLDPTTGRWMHSLCRHRRYGSCVMRTSCIYLPNFGQKLARARGKLERLQMLLILK